MNIKLEQSFSQVSFTDIFKSFESHQNVGQLHSFTATFVSCSLFYILNYISEKYKVFYEQFK